MTLTDTRPRERRIENTGTATKEGGPRSVVKKTPNVDGFIELIKGNMSMTGREDIADAADPTVRREMARSIVTCISTGSKPVSATACHCLRLVSREVPAGTSAVTIVDGVLERAVAKD